MNLPAEVLAVLSDPAYRRADPVGAREMLRSLSTPVSATLTEFYERYEGPFQGSGSGFLLLDVLGGSPSVQTQTRVCRERYGFEVNHIVLTELLGNAVVVLDSSTDRVFNVDFEGGDVDFVQGRLPPSWPSFEAFLCDLFAV